MMCCTPSFAINAAHKEETNCTPLSEVMQAGTPKRATQPVTRAATQSAVVTAFSGYASAHRVDLSMPEKIY
jgi:hypothetical protein